jgi:hypothetical protein
VNRRRSISLLLAALLIGQAVWAPWHHSHCQHHEAAYGERATSHADCHQHASAGEEHSPQRNEAPPTRFPADEDDCTLCRLLAESPLPTIDRGLAPAGRIVLPLIATDETLICCDIIGLRRARSPPGLG